MKSVTSVTRADCCTSAPTTLQHQPLLGTLPVDADKIGPGAFRSGSAFYGGCCRGARGVVALSCHEKNPV